ncbi:MAG TPA: S41 family peptidase [Candidatus Paceibacterota bacterium]|jgi:carboxyl-terminal processing protease|nr:S41 family peptidase [Candidatus Paceibacterota bacterium]
MHTSKRFSLAIILGFVILGSFSFGFFAGSTQGPESAVPALIANSDSAIQDSVDFSTFWKAWTVLNDKFAGTSTPPQERVWGSIKGLADSFNDPYTVFFPPEEAKIFEEEIKGNFEGVGMEVGIKDGRITVVAPIKGSPAERAGIKTGDQILKIGDTSTEGLALEAAIKLIRGKAGTSVTLTLGRTGEKAPLEIKVTRAVIDIPTIRTKTKDEVATAGSTQSGTGLRKDGIFVIELYSFSANSANLFRNALKDFVDSGSKKLILDLRGNPGGYLEAAVDMASWFLPKGEIVLKEEFGKQKEEHVYRSKGYDIFGDDLQMVILVNGGSASASEILAGALSENGVATLVGTKTFGKGSVQELVKITPETSIKVTIARWLTPKGTSISKTGITPQYVVEFTEADFLDKKDPQMEKAVELLSQKQ